jgi:16S rRNA (cytosine967-C5)-methyltransferase
MQQAQMQAAAIVGRVIGGEALPAALAAVARPDGAAGRRRALVQELAYGTLRHWGTLEALVRALAKKPLPDAGLTCLVAVALYQLDHTRAPPFAIVDHAVNTAGAMVRPAAKSLVNALLRRYLRERDALNVAVRANPVARWSYPQWWIDRVTREYPDRWEAILEAGNARPPLSLRVNRRATTRDALLARFALADITAVAAGEAGIIVDPPRPVAQLPGFAEGEFSVQDLGAQLAGPVAELVPGMRVLDACAAPGGKTTHIAELADVDLVALDIDEARLARVRENLVRLKLSNDRTNVFKADAGASSAWWDGVPFDRIVADVPCTASGVVRRHPDGKWLRREADISSFARQQARVLDSLWPCLARGGKLLYATCSVFADENENGVGAFMARHTDALRETLTFASGIDCTGGQLLPSLPGACHNQDGFFYARLRKA